MEQLYKEGKIIIEDGLPKIDFIKGSFKTEIMFKKSIQNVVGVISCYDVEKLRDRDYYYLYNKDLGKVNPIEVRDDLNKIFEGDISNVLDKEHFTLGVLNDTVENTIFWDVLNDIIVVKGKDNLKQLWIELEWMGYAKYGLDYKGERKVNFILNQKNPSRVLDKVKRMNNI